MFEALRYLMDSYRLAEPPSHSPSRSLFCDLGFGTLGLGRVALLAPRPARRPQNRNADRPVRVPVFSKLRTLITAVNYANGQLCSLT